MSVFLVVQINIEIIGAIVTCGPFLNEPVFFFIINDMIVVERSNVVIGLAVEDVNIDLDVDIAVAAGIRIVADVDGGIFGVVVPLIKPLVIILAAALLVEASLVTRRKFDARDVKAVFVIVVIIVQVDYKVIRSVVVCCPVLAERIQFTSIDGVRERLPVN